MRRHRQMRQIFLAGLCGAPLAPLAAMAQVSLPDITLSAHKARPARASKPLPVKVAKVTTAPARVAPTRFEPAAFAPQSAAAVLDKKMRTLDAARDALLPKTGASSYTIDQAAIERLPQGDNTPIDKVILQAPGVSQDSAVA